MTTVFIYALTDPDTGAIRYIGKASTPRERYGAHFWNLRGEKTHKAKWIRSLLAVGKKPGMRVLKSVPATDWEWWECAYIRGAKALGFPLTNGTDGGDNPPSWQGKKHTQEALANMSAAQLGKKRSPETCAAISAGKLGKKMSLEARAANRVGQLGRKHSPETKALIRAGNVGKKKSPEHRAALRASHLGKKLSPEHRANMRVSRLAWLAAQLRQEEQACLGTC